MSIVYPGLHATRNPKKERGRELTMVQVSGNGVHQRIGAIDR